MLIYENKYDKNINNFIKKYTGEADFSKVRDFLLKKVFHEIPELRLFDNPEPVIKAIEWFYDENGSPKERDFLIPFRQILQTWKEKQPKTFNMMAVAMKGNVPRSFIQDYSHLVRYQPNEVNVGQTKKEFVTPNGYRVRRIDSFEEFNSISNGKFVWCISNDEEWWDEMVGFETTVYLLENYDIDVPETEWMDNGETHPDEYFSDFSYSEALQDKNWGTFGSGKYPYSKYGLQQMVVLSNKNGMFEVFSGFNMTNGKDGSYLTKRELSELIGMDADKAFPYVKM